MYSFRRILIYTKLPNCRIMYIVSTVFAHPPINCGCDLYVCRGHLNCDGTSAETRYRLSAKRTSPFKSAEALVQSTFGSRGVRISGSNAGYTIFRGSVKSTDYPLHSPVSPSLPRPCVTVCHHISAGLYIYMIFMYFYPLAKHNGKIFSAFLQRLCCKF